MKAYYAHPVSLYNTPQEVRDLKAMADLGIQVFNPNSQECSDGYAREGMPFFTKIIRECDLVIFRAFADGSIPAGVVKEIADGVALGYPILEFPVSVARRTVSSGPIADGSFNVCLVAGVAAPWLAGAGAVLPNELYAAHAGHVRFFAEHLAGHEALLFSSHVHDGSASPMKWFPERVVPEYLAKAVRGARERKIPVLEVPVAVAARSLSVQETREYLNETSCR
jgi:hypothetical protein